MALNNDAIDCAFAAYSSTCQAFQAEPNRVNGNAAISAYAQWINLFLPLDNAENMASREQGINIVRHRVAIAIANDERSNN